MFCFSGFPDKENHLHWCVATGDPRGIFCVKKWVHVSLMSFNKAQCKQGPAPGSGQLLLSIEAGEGMKELRAAPPRMIWGREQVEG